MSHAPSILALLRAADQLARVPRTGWLGCGVRSPESVAAHAYHVAVCALALADAHDGPVDRARLARIALAHDLPEALTTDLPRPVKRALGREAVERADRAAARSIMGGADPRWLACWEEYEQRASLEARIVKAADILCLLAKALTYRAQGFDGTEPFWASAAALEGLGVPAAREVLARLERHRRDGDWPAGGFAPAELGLEEPDA